MAAIRGILCDIDGTLIDSNAAHARAFSQAFADNGHDIPVEKIRPLIGMGGDKLIPQLTGLEKDSPPFKAISERRKQIYLEQYVPHLQPTPGAKEFLERLKAEHIQIVAATSGEEDTNVALKQVGLDAYFEEKASSKDAAQSKPDPDIVQAALRKAGLHADEAVMLGDTPYDIEAAQKANVRILALLCGGWKRDNLAAAAAIYESPADLLAHFDQSLLSGSQTAGSTSQSIA